LVGVKPETACADSKIFGPGFGAASGGRD